MRRILQIFGPITLLLTVASAEAAAAALSRAPSSALLWQINLRVFGFLQPAATLLFSFLHLAYSDLLVAGILGIATSVGMARKSRFVLAIANHVCLGYAGIVMACWLRSGNRCPAELSDRFFGLDWSFEVAQFLIVVSSASALASQVEYLHIVRRRNVDTRAGWDAWLAPAAALS